MIFEFDRNVLGSKQLKGDQSIWRTQAYSNAQCKWDLIEFFQIMATNIVQIEKWAGSNKNQKKIIETVVNY